MDKHAIPIFTMFMAPTDIDKSDDIWFGYSISGEKVIGLGETLNQLKEMIKNIEDGLFK